MSEDKGGEYTKRLSQELKSSLYQRDPEMWNGDGMPPPDLQEILGNPADPRTSYSRGPPSVSSGVTGQRSYSHAGYDGLPIESGMQGLDINGPGGGGGGENSVYGTYGNQNDEDTLQHYTNNQTDFDQELPQPPNDNNQVAAWYDTDL